MRNLQQRIVVSGGVAVDILSEPLSGAQWRDLANACGVTAKALGAPYRVRLGEGATVECDTLDEVQALAELLASKLSRTEAIDSAVAVKSTMEPLDAQGEQKVLDA